MLSLVDAIVMSPQRREAFIAAYKTVHANIPPGYEEVLRDGMVAWQVPLKAYPDTYNGQPFMYAALRNQKNHAALYLMVAYSNKNVEAMLREGYREAGKKLDFGKSCLRFKKLADLGYFHNWRR